MLNFGGELELRGGVEHVDVVVVLSYSVLNMNLILVAAVPLT